MYNELIICSLAVSAPIPKIIIKKIFGCAPAVKQAASTKWYRHGFYNHEFYILSNIRADVIPMYAFSDKSQDTNLVPLHTQLYLICY